MPLLLLPAGRKLSSSRTFAPGTVVPGITTTNGAVVTQVNALANKQFAVLGECGVTNPAVWHGTATQAKCATGFLAASLSGLTDQ